jgi:DNA-binding transcriptional LysR family regulator
VIPRLGRGPVPKTVRILQSEPTLRRHVHAVWRKDASRRVAIRAVVDAFHAAGRTAVSD